MEEGKVHINPKPETTTAPRPCTKPVGHGKIPQAGDDESGSEWVKLENYESLKRHADRLWRELNELIAWTPNDEYMLYSAYEALDEYFEIFLKDEIRDRKEKI